MELSNRMVTLYIMMETASHLDALRLAVLEAMIADAAFDGWTIAALERCCAHAGEGKAVETLFPRGVRDVLDLWSSREDDRAVQSFLALDPPPQRIRDKITTLVRLRVEGMQQDREAARRAGATLALPIHAGCAHSLSWRTADAIWRAVGDTSKDFNHYTKRATLSAVYTTTLLRWFADDESETGEPWQATWDFLDQRIDNVMSFEKTKATLQKRLPNMDAFFEACGRVRHGRRAS